MLRKKSNYTTHPNMEKAFKEVTAEKMVFITIKAPESLRKKLKVKSAKENTTHTDLITGWIEEYLKE
jgi:hypothetical protein